jgi:hypothetical protein
VGEQCGDVTLPHLRGREQCNKVTIPHFSPRENERVRVRGVETEWAESEGENERGPS